MESSTTFMAYQELIQAGWLRFQSLELNKTLDLLEQKGLISATEHKALLDLAQKLEGDGSSHS